ncbi:MAG: glycosyltransferase family 39 protein, partial [Sideroxyarcus sp.]|nr:glycosyltransferase family 39 protein [Sideroxyarcus sp.]
MFSVLGKIFQKRSLIVGTVTVLFVLLLTSVYVFSAQIHGDAQYHEILTRQILQSGWPLTEDHFTIMSFAADGSPHYAPVNYPEGAYLLYAGFLKIGTVALQFSSSLFAGLIALIVFLFLRPFGDRIAAAGAGAAIIFNMRRFIMSPILEQPLLAASMATALFLALWLEKARMRYAIAAGVCAGIAMSIKQQGLLIGPICGAVALIVLLLKQSSGKRKKILIQAAGALGVALLVTMPFQIEHLQRNGTIG